ncbi:MAG: endonuclease [Synergistaceae bacterium]|jgi:RNase H-fold protein (predicted Holliday junction resolvase)|nr:endonuclease [Synergistaceae bacterium]
MKCGIDPGRYKIGFALIDEENLLFSAIVPKSEEVKLAEAIENNDWILLSEWSKEGSVDSVLGKVAGKILLGDGTSHDETKKLLKDSIKVEIVSEYGTTLKARELYWQLHPPKWLWKIVPTSLRVPPRDIDDLAAWAIVILNTNK